MLIEKFELYQAGHPQYYSGQIVTRSAIVDSGSGKVLWPEGDKGAKTLRSVVELETGGKTKATARLMNSTSHCITRYFYNCPKDQFRTSDEGSFEIEAMEFNQI